MLLCEQCNSQQDAKTCDTCGIILCDACLEEHSENCGRMTPMMVSEDEDFFYTYHDAFDDYFSDSSKELYTDSD